MVASQEQAKSWRVAHHPARHASEWWDYARASYSAPEAVRPLLTEMPSEELRVTAAEAEAIVRWAASLPGWQGDPAHTGTVLIIEPVED